MGHTMADRSSNAVRLSVYFLYLAWRLWKSVVTLAVKGNTVSCRLLLLFRGCRSFIGIDCC
jgi:hypothetical protein